MTSPDEPGLVEPTSFLSRSDLPSPLLAEALKAIESDTVVSVGERRIHAKNVALMAAARIEALTAEVARLTEETHRAWHEGYEAAGKSDAAVVVMGEPGYALIEREADEEGPAGVYIQRTRSWPFEPPVGSSMGNQVSARSLSRTDEGDRP